MGREEIDPGYELLQSGRMNNWSTSHVLVRIGIFSSFGVGLVFFLEMLCAALKGNFQLWLFRWTFPGELHRQTYSTIAEKRYPLCFIYE